MVVGIEHAQQSDSKFIRSAEQWHQALGGRFKLAADTVSEMQQQHGLSVSQLLTALIPSATALARPAISDFKVGAVGLGGSGAVYIGANLEFRGTQLNNSVHAEQFLLANAWWHGERSIRQIAVSAAPCGHCRQFYSELGNAESLRIVFGEPPSEYTLPQLLPQRFGPVDLLGNSGTPLLLEPQNNRVTFSVPANDTISSVATLDRTSSVNTADTHNNNGRVKSCQMPGSTCPSVSWSLQGGALPTKQLAAAAEAALHAARQAYCPYTRSPSGVALLLADGSLHWGGYIESAAFNPSFAPLQSALTAAVRAGISCYTQVTHAVLVEVPSAPVQQAEAAALLLSKISPDAKLVIIPADLIPMA